MVLRRLRASCEASTLCARLLGMLTLTAFAVLLAPATPGGATENGNNAYPTGVNTVLPGLMPPPGATEVYNYDESYTASAFNDATGKSAVPNFGLSVSAVVLRLVHTYKFHAGPFAFSSALVQPYLNLNLQAAGHAGHQAGLGDTTVNPLDIDYVSPDHKLFLWAGADVFVPTGSYKLSNVANVGNNYFTYMPEFVLTWIPNPKFQASFQATQENHSLNHATGYQSGSSYGVDYGFDYAPIAAQPKLHVSLQGYAFEQFTPDTVKGQIFRDGNYGRSIGLGPQLRYDLPGGGIAIKYQRELSVQNRPQGNRYWLQFALPL